MPRLGAGAAAAKTTSVPEDGAGGPIGATQVSPEQIVGGVGKTGALASVTRRSTAISAGIGGPEATVAVHPHLSKFGRKRYRSHDSRGVLPGSAPSASGRWT